MEMIFFPPNSGTEFTLASAVVLAVLCYPSLCVTDAAVTFSLSRVKGKHAFSHVICCSQAETLWKDFFFCHSKSLSSKPAALSDITASHSEKKKTIIMAHTAKWTSSNSFTAEWCRQGFFWRVVKIRFVCPCDCCFCLFASFVIMCN